MTKTAKTVFKLILDVPVLYHKVFFYIVYYYFDDSLMKLQNVYIERIGIFLSSNPAPCLMMDNIVKSLL